jgi:hypothetical protein
MGRWCKWNWSYSRSFILFCCIYVMHIYILYISAHSTVITTHLLPAITHLTPHATLSCVQERFAIATHEMSESTGFDLKSILLVMCVLALKSNDHSDPKVQNILRNMGWTRLQSAPCAAACAETACMNAAWCARLFCPYIGYRYQNI